MEETIQNAIEAIRAINNDSITMNEAALLRVEVCQDYVGICFGDTTVWDSEDEHAEGCDGSIESITTHVMEQLDLIKSQLEDIIAVYSEG
jgi:hypothetical protein